MGGYLARDNVENAWFACHRFPKPNDDSGSLRVYSEVAMPVIHLGGLQRSVPDENQRGCLALVSNGECTKRTNSFPNASSRAGIGVSNQH